jgi:hypothetical protein
MGGGESPARSYKQLPGSRLACRLEPRLAAPRASTEEAAWVEARTEGRTITLEEAVSYVLE